MADRRRVSSTPLAHTARSERDRATAANYERGGRFAGERHHGSTRAYVNARRRGSEREGGARHGRPREERGRAGGRERRFEPMPQLRGHDGRGIGRVPGTPRRMSPLPQRRVPVVPIAGVAAAAALALAIHGCATPAPVSSGPYNGTGGIESSPLFAADADIAYTTSLLAPTELAPSNPDWPQVAGVQRPSHSVMGELVEATRAIEDEGYEVGYALLDLNTGITVTYNADASFYSASSIKGPYVTSLAAFDLGDSVQNEANRISAIIENSDNAAYATLRDAYGNEPFAQLVDATGAAELPSHGATDEVAAAAQVQSGASIADNKYEFFTPNQMLALWRGCYEYLSGGTEGAEWLASEFEKPETSTIRVTASSLGTTWSKAGWYPGEESGYGTTVDAGVVRTDEGDFILAVMTTKPEDFTAMETIVSPLITLRASLVA